MTDKRGPRLREGAEFELRYAAAQAVKELIERGIQATCITCIHFSEYPRNDANERHNGEFCRLFNGRPPARVIAYGCNSYANDDEIPFD